MIEAGRADEATLLRSAMIPPPPATRGVPLGRQLGQEGRGGCGQAKKERDMALMEKRNSILPIIIFMFLSFRFFGGFFDYYCA